MYLKKKYEIHLSSDENLKVNVGLHSVQIEKLYGPASFSDLRITPVVEEEWYWLIEMYDTASGEFVEVLRLQPIIANADEPT